MLYPAEYIVDNRPGEVLYTNVAPIDENSNLDLTSPNNVLHKFNSVEGGIIVPRGCSLVGTDLRRTKIIPKYVPYPTVAGSLGITDEIQVPPRTAVFKVTGGTYFWQFSFSGRWIENDKGFEITDTEYIGDGSRDPINLENSKDRGALETVFKSHEIAEFLDDNEMTENDFWKSVLPEFKWLKDGV